MEEIVIVMAYCDNFKKQETLRKLVRNVKSFNYKILIISHSILPEDILKSCDYHFYDKENKLLYGKGYCYKKYIKCSLPSYGMENTVFSTYDSYTLHNNSACPLLPCLRLFLFGLGIAKQLGYSYAHVVEYDCDVTKAEFFKNNTKILEEGYENLTYRWEVDFGDFKGDLEPVGCYLGINLNFYTFKDLEYRESDILNNFKPHSPIIENFVYDNYIDHNLNNKKRKTYIKYINHQPGNVTSPIEDNIPLSEGLVRDTIKSSKPKLNLELFPFIKGEYFDIVIFADTVNEEPQPPPKYEIILNDRVFKGSFLPYQCHVYNWGIKYEDVYYLRLSIEGEIFAEYNLHTKEEKSKFYNLYYKS